MNARSIFALAVLVGALGACKTGDTASPDDADSAAPVDAWAVHERLEQRIAGGEKVGDAERMAALERVRSAPDDGSAGYAYARASVAGRVAEGRGLKALKLLEEMQTWAKTSIERDPEFRDMAATRMLGTLYVLAGRHLKAGDSEEGLELLEDAAAAHPDSAIAHLRLAEGYVALGDPEPALDSLCVARAGEATLSTEERELLAGVIEDIGGEEMLACDGDGGGS